MSDIASANEAYGQLKANLFIAGFTLERAFHGFLEPLLKDSQWKLCGPGYDDVNKFMNSLRLDKFRVIAEDRKAIVQRIKQLQPKVSNRQIARTLGVSDQTVNNDAKNLAAARDKSGGAATGSAKNLAPALTGGEAARTVEQREQSAKADPSARRATPERDGPDFWPTPVSLANALVRHVLPELPPGPIWECAEGDGRLTHALRAAGREVYGSDLYPQDDQTKPVDFLCDDPVVQGAIAVTNPPYNSSDEFLARCLALWDNKVIAGFVLLLRHDHLQAAGRVDAFNRATREVHCNWRPTWIPGTEDKGPRWSFHWIAWAHEPRQPPLYLTDGPDR